MRKDLDPFRPNGFFVEDERSESGEIVPVATILLLNRECPWRCLMCDLWKGSLEAPAPPGAISAQLDYALERLPAARQIKLYNSGSFFDPRAIPRDEHRTIASRLSCFERVIVESHPALVTREALRFAELLDGRLEVAMGLETIHPDVLPRLNKRMTLEQFKVAARVLCEESVALRVFVLLKPPFLDEAEALLWTARSIDFASDSGASVVSIIPTRPGNGALDALAAAGEFSPPRLEAVEAALAAAIERARGRVFADLWDIARFSECARCLPDRRNRLRLMNLHQIVPDCIHCERCHP